MTERFILKHFESGDWIYDNGTYIDAKIIVELLNDFDKKCIEQHERIQVLENENEELKSHLQMWELIYDD